MKLFIYKIKTFHNWVIWLCLSGSGFIIGFLVRSALINRKLDVDYAAWATLLLTLITAAVIVWQGKQLQKQLELQTLTELYKEWNSEDMRNARCELCSVLPMTSFSDDNLNKVERVIEFLERIASYYENGVLKEELVWATIGWYVMRYYHYTNEAIREIRKKWGDDKTLYEDIQDMYDELLPIEFRLRKEKKEHSLESMWDIEKKFDNEIEKFKKSECYGKSKKHC